MHESICVDEILGPTLVGKACTGKLWKVTEKSLRKGRENKVTLHEEVDQFLVEQNVFMILNTAAG